MENELLLTLMEVDCLMIGKGKPTRPLYDVIEPYLKAQLTKAKQHYEQKIGEALRDFSDIQREEGHPKSYWAGYHYARNLVMFALQMEQKNQVRIMKGTEHTEEFDHREQKRLDRPDREKSKRAVMASFCFDYEELSKPRSFNDVSELVEGVYEAGAEEAKKQEREK